MSYDRPGCCLTVLRSINRKYATKQFTWKPKTGEFTNRSYGKETFFSVRSIPVAGIRDLASCAVGADNAAV